MRTRQRSTQHRPINVRGDAMALPTRTNITAEKGRFLFDPPSITPSHTALYVLDAAAELSAALNPILAKEEVVGALYVCYHAHRLPVKMISRRESQGGGGWVSRREVAFDVLHPNDGPIVTILISCDSILSVTHFQGATGQSMFSPTLCVSCDSDPRPPREPALHTGV